MAIEARNVIVEVLRDFDEVKQIGPIADRMMEELGNVMVAVDPGECAPPVYVSALAASPAGVPEPYAAATTDHTGCVHIGAVEGIEAIAAAGAKGPTEVVYLYEGPAPTPQPREKAP